MIQLEREARKGRGLVASCPLEFVDFADRDSAGQNRRIVWRPLEDIIRAPHRYFLVC